MKKNLLLLIISGLVFFESKSQNDTIQSLIKSIDSNLPDSTRIEHQILLANQLTQNNIITSETLERSVKWARKSAVEAERLGLIKLQAKAVEELAYSFDQQGKYDSCGYMYAKAVELHLLVGNKMGAGNCLNQLGIQRAIEGDNDSALVLFNQVKNLRTAINDSSGLAGAINNLGIVYYRTGKYMEAIDTYQESFRIMELINDEQGIVEVLTNIALIHVDRKDFDHARDNYHQALNYALKIASKPDLAILYNNIGNLYMDLNQLDSSIYYQNKSFELYSMLDDECGLIYPTIALGLNFLSQAKYDSAEKFLKRGLTGSENCHNTDQLISAKSKLGLLHQQKGDMQQAEKFLKEALKIAIETDYHIQIQEVAYSLYMLYKEMDKNHLSLEHLELYQSMTDSVYSEELKNQSARLEAEYDFLKEKQQIQHEAEKRELDLESKLSRQYSRQFIMLIAILVVSALLILTWRYSKIKQASNLKLQALNDAISQQNEEIEAQKVQLEKQNEKLSTINLEKNDLIAVVAHDLRSPLNNIFGLSRLIQMDGDNLNDDQKKMLEHINNSTKRLTDMISTVLDVQAIENQTIHLMIEKVELSKLFDDISSSFKFTLKKKKIEVVNHLEGKNMYVLADVNHLRQALENLLSNAIKFSKKNKKIYLGAQLAEDGKVHISVKDEGPGISDIDQKKLFQKFTKLSASPTAGETTTGLGLSIVKKYVEAMNGTIACESAIDEGACFIISLPAA